jgi:hypothetical protein
VSPFTIPFETFEAQISLSSLAKTLVSRLGDPRRRVADACVGMARTLASAHKSALLALFKTMFARGSLALGAGRGAGGGGPGGISLSGGAGLGGGAADGDAGAGGAALRAMLQQSSSLRLLCELLQSPLVAASGPSLQLPLEAMLATLSQCLRSHSAAVWHAAKQCVETLTACVTMSSNEERSALQVWSALSCHFVPAK